MDNPKDLRTSFNVQPLEAIKAVDSMEFAFARPLSTLEDGRLRDVLREALQNGSTRKEVGCQIREQIMDEIHYASDDGSSAGALSKTWAETVADTELSRALNLGSLSTYVKQDISVIQWLTAEDERTCARCAALANKLAPVGKNFEGTDKKCPPLHPGCRCTTVADWSFLDD